ncbi:DivIVA domain-containing protein [Gordonia westfalica]|uniref:DivIVA domain-containing protein n=1 Tax=Gordonia westfalica TaxID=158898 RepID=A0A1H2IPA7_9ACTN|nr:DivIVA domain-containing protein [Gordonia westfalica]MDS1114434.1 DivIVA domain-containing protein [Gordonia westfalica]SDU45933.1 DivIVA domain-containing protein [Gordonia westfalica]
MQTLLLYLLIMALVAGAVFAVVWFVFGRGEELPPVEPDTTLTRLPRVGIGGDDVRALRFAQTFRGYKQSEVDWALARLAREVDDLRAVIARLRERESGSGPLPGATGVPEAAEDDAAAPENGREQAAYDDPTPNPASREAGPSIRSER